MVRVAKTMAKTSKTTIEALTKLRELSDGFQYKEVKDGLKECDLCHGSGIYKTPDPNQETVEHNLGSVDGLKLTIDLPKEEPKLIEKECPNCNGKGQVDKLKRTYTEVPCPKDEALVDLLDEFEDVGRVVIYAGFTASIDRCVKIALRQKWSVIRVDQGKDTILDGESGKILPIQDWITMFQDQQEEYPRIAFIAHPGSAGMGLTLTASPVIIYFSNDFNAESRIQSEDRIHRPGMDVNLGATIIDLIHLPSDQKVLDNLRQKRVLQSMTLGEVQKFIEDDSELVGREV
jgi:SNF2 family DNA or RNA helicase